MTEYTADQLRGIAHTLIYEGFLQESDIENAERILSRLSVRENVKQKTVRELREANGE